MSGGRTGGRSAAVPSVAVVRHHQHFVAGRVQRTPRRIRLGGQGVQRPLQAVCLVARGQNDGQAQARVGRLRRSTGQGIIGQDGRRGVGRKNSGRHDVSGSSLSRTGARHFPVVPKWPGFAGRPPQYVLMLLLPVDRLLGREQVKERQADSDGETGDSADEGDEQGEGVEQLKDTRYWRLMCRTNSGVRRGSIMPGCRPSVKPGQRSQDMPHSQKPKA